jgi:hypothetical protein
MTPPMTSPLTPAGPAPTTGERSEPEPGGLLLHRWRRLDWHFLLPSSEWTRIACGGRVDDELGRALPLLAPEVHEVASAADWSALSGSCDVVVLVEPTPAQLALAVAALRPGGWLYAEVRRALRSSGPRSLLGWRRALVRAGLEQVAVHWHAPGLADTQRIISVDAAVAVRHALGGHESFLKRLRAAVTEVPLRCGLFPVVVPEGSVIGRRPLTAP